MFVFQVGFLMNDGEVRKKIEEAKEIVVKDGEGKCIF